MKTRFHIGKWLFSAVLSASLMVAPTGWLTSAEAAPKKVKMPKLKSKKVKKKSVRVQFPQAVSDHDFYDYGELHADKFELGRNLFYDKILSGNTNISCATCHHSLLDTGDGLSLPIGEGALGLGVTRDTGHGSDAVHERVPRNAPPVFNLGAKEFHRMFADGRVEVDPLEWTGFKSPAGSQLPPGLENVLAVQAMFPVTSPTEMAGQPNENTVAHAAHLNKLAGPGGVWDQLANRLRAIPGYQNLFLAAYPELTSPSQITFVHAANAIAAFEAFSWRADDSAFDRFLKGDPGGLSLDAVRGMELFYGKARCADCHSGTFFTDHEFYAIAMPQIGPGKGDGVDGREDYGRMRVTGLPQDRFRFRTPTLRNVALTGPWGHDGAYNTLEGVVRHHLDPVQSLENYDPSQAMLPSRPDLDAKDFLVHNDPLRRAAIAAANELEPVKLKDDEVQDLIAFLHALTDPSSLDLRLDVPRRVPSGAPVFD